MSPEQAEGARTDFRADQFALGLVLYELVTGRRPFVRRTAAETLVAIMRERHEPIVATQRDAPAPFCWAIERCLEKDPSRRFPGTRELARELAAIRDCFEEVPRTRSNSMPATLPVSRNGFVGREKEAEAARELFLARRRSPRDHHRPRRHRQDPTCHRSCRRLDRTVSRRHPFRATLRRSPIRIRFHPRSSRHSVSAKSANNLPSTS